MLKEMRKLNFLVVMAGALLVSAHAQPQPQSAAPAPVEKHAGSHLCDALRAAQLQVKPTRSEALWPAGTAGIPVLDGALGPSRTPHIDLYVADENPTHTVVVIFPGGGYGCIAQANEGIPVAQWWNARGVSAAVVTYRIAPDAHYPAPLEDGRRAVQWVRAHAAEFHAEANHVGLMGFSAGGHLAAITATTAFDPVPEDWLTLPDLSGVSSRPDFLMLGYPVITMKEGTHGGTRKNLLGKSPDAKLVDEYSAEDRVNGNTPPTFIFSTTDDGSVPIQNSMMFYQALVRANVPVEMHLYEHGRHGLGLAEESPEVSTWPQLLANWAVMHGWMAAKFAVTEQSFTRTLGGGQTSSAGESSSKAQATSAGVR
jgi:acetyl esterase/lipase